MKKIVILSKLFHTACLNYEVKNAVRAWISYIHVQLSFLNVVTFAEAFQTFGFITRLKSNRTMWSFLKS